MRGRAFLDSARRLNQGRVEADWRTAAGRAYYAVLQEAKSALQRWGFSVPGRNQLHSWVRLRFVYAADADLKRIGDTLERLSLLRNEADYQLDHPGRFTKNTDVQAAIKRSDDAIVLLDRIDADPARRAAAIAAIQATIIP